MTKAKNNPRLETEYPGNLDPKKVCEHLGPIRKRMTWSEDDLAKAAGLTVARIKELEGGGGAKAATWEELEAIAKALVFKPEKLTNSDWHELPVPFDAAVFGEVFKIICEVKDWKSGELEGKLGFVIGKVDSVAEDKSVSKDKSVPTWKALNELIRKWCSSRSSAQDSGHNAKKLDGDIQLGEVLRRYRGQKWQPAQLARAVGLKEEQIKEIEAGTLQPSEDTLLALLWFFGLCPIAMKAATDSSDSGACKPDSLGALLAWLRAKRKWDQKGLAGLLGCDESLIGKYENRSPMPGWRFGLLARKLELHLEFLKLGLPRVEEKGAKAIREQQSLPAPPPAPPPPPASPQVSAPSQQPAKLDGQAKREKLTNLVRGKEEVVFPEGEEGTLFVVVTDASFLFVWLWEIYEEYTSTEKPKIAKVMILHRAEGKLRRLMKDDKSKQLYYERLVVNLKSIHALLNEHEVKIEIFEREKMPDWHGFCYGNHLLSGSFQEGNKGKIKGRGPTLYYRGEPKQDEFNRFLRQFKDEATRSKSQESSGKSMQGKDSKKRTKKNGKGVAKNGPKG